MSTFEGRIIEIPGVSIDRFDNENLNSSVFFLSHCHLDHMRGLNSEKFTEKLLNEQKFLYLSPISAVILRTWIPIISERIQELPLEQSTSINFENNSFSVTCIPAGHCPGSVMFLFETCDGNFLYTGDFRINISDIKKFKCFYDTFGNVKPMAKIYLDTTFFLESYRTFPKREESLNKLCTIILSWIAQGSDYCIKLDLRAKYGYEYAYKEIYEKCKMPVHVDEEKFSIYSVIPELDKCITTDGFKTQIHNCKFIQKEICDACTDCNIRIVRLSAFRWKNDDFKQGIVEVGENETFFVCYSTHASYEEVVSLINFLKPLEIHACVEHQDPVDYGNLRNCIEMNLTNNNKSNESKESTAKLFNLKRKSFHFGFNALSESDGTSSEPSTKALKYDFTLDSPPRS